MGAKIGAHDRASPLILDLMQIAVADAAVDDLHEHISRARWPTLKPPRLEGVTLVFHCYAEALAFALCRLALLGEGLGQLRKADITCRATTSGQTRD